MTFLVAALLALLTAAVSVGIRLANHNVRLLAERETADAQRIADANWLRQYDADFSPERRLDLMTRVAKGEPLVDIWLSDWSDL
jgi:hypothetical protein